MTEAINKDNKNKKITASKRRKQDNISDVTMVSLMFIVKFNHFQRVVRTMPSIYDGVFPRK